MSNILAVDIGGTKTIVALFEVVDNVLNLKHQHQYASQSFTSFSDILVDFKKRFLTTSIDAASLGVAGPVIEGNCKTTNLPWGINGRELKKQLNTTKVKLLNDLEATAYGMLYLDENEFVELNPKAKVTQGNRAVIAAGTGLGEAQLFWDGEGYHPIGSEGGHCDFAPVSVEQDALLVWLRSQYPNHVSYERILSGPGIAALYDFLVSSGFAKENEKIKHLSEDSDRSAMISHCALEENDPLCRETLRLFAEIYGAEAGNLALKSMSLGGVYIGGGIAPKILPFIRSRDFMDAFVKKGRFEKILSDIPVKISLNPETALLGAAYYARDRLLKN
ncbi:MAG: glucokinase [Sulfuricurvum sp.]|uniref:glucokinase n=1 Tax=Sulfuricurvum sp. TaxID=2025608 RepID=UPI00262BDFC0|nr:glucokinase [Sulfuricurvum sp.]MDD2829482.1 glucokinase [Sulfuricurvum sp.]MDD4949521.1 glucokinase [Sulfuricurvum sp.]